MFKTNNVSGSRDLEGDIWNIQLKTLQTYHGDKLLHYLQKLFGCSLIISIINRYDIFHNINNITDISAKDFLRCEVLQSFSNGDWIIAMGL